MDAANARPEGKEEPKLVSPGPKKKGITPKRSTVPAQVKPTPDNMIVMALQANRSMEEIKSLIDLRNAEIKRIAELEFNEAKAEFLKTVPAIKKNREADFKETNSGKRGASYKYSDLDNLINTVKEAEGNAGLSHDWKDGKNEKGEIEVTCILSHVGGHSKSTTLSFGLDTSGGKNGIQAMKSTISYLRRATLESVLGLPQGGEDDDGHAAQRDEKGLEKLNAEQFNQVVRSIMGGTLTVENVRKTYSLSAEQETTLEGLKEGLKR
jgi:hypothetical protein